MSAAAVVVQRETALRGTVMAFIFIPAITMAACVWNEGIFYYYPDPGHQRALVAWAIAAGSIVASVVLSLMLTVCHDKAQITNSQRLVNLSVILVLPMLGLQPAFNETFYAFYPDNKTDRWLAMGVTFAVLLFLALVVCWLVCNVCTGCYKSMGELLLQRDAQEYSRVSTQQE
jgi:Na+/melibiose symporter-like transporter